MAEEQLADKQYITVVLRLVVDSRRQSVQGHVVEVGSQQAVYFRGWRGLVRTLRGLIAHPAPADAPPVRCVHGLPLGAGSKPQPDLSATSAADQSDLTGG